MTYLHAHLIARLAAIHRWNPEEQVSWSRQREGPRAWAAGKRVRTDDAQMKRVWLLSERFKHQTGRNTTFSTGGVWSVGRIFALFGSQCCLHSVEVRFLLELAYVLLVTNSLVAKPVGDLKETTSYFFILFVSNIPAVSVNWVRVKVIPLEIHLRGTAVGRSPTWPCYHPGQPPGLDPSKCFSIMGFALGTPQDNQNSNDMILKDRYCIFRTISRTFFP